MPSRAADGPWDEEGFLAAFARWQAVLDLPPGRRGAAPMATFFIERYGRERGLTHFRRWLRIGDFLARHIERLQADGLVWASPEGALEMRPDLIRALCRTPLRRNRLPLADVLRSVRRGRAPRRGRRRTAARRRRTT